MKNGKFVFDCVVHMVDNRPENVTTSEARRVVATTEEMAGNLTTGDFPLQQNWQDNADTVEEAYDLLFRQSDTDIAMAQTVPLFGWWKDGLSPARLNYELAAAHPDRVLFCGGVDPVYHGVENAVNEIDRQVREWGAVSFKFYQAHRHGLSWRADDRRLAYPMWEKCLELGVKTVQFHKGVPFGTEHAEDLHPRDLQEAAVDFPDLTFIVHHLGGLYLDETVSLAARNENIWIALSSWINQYPVQPMAALHRLGEALFHVGSERLLWGSEAFIWPRVQGYIDLFDTLEMPEELQDGFGYPALTDEIKRRIFGENFARLLGMDIAAVSEQLSDGQSGSPLEVPGVRRA